MYKIVGKVSLEVALFVAEGGRPISISPLRNQGPSASVGEPASCCFYQITVNLQLNPIVVLSCQAGVDHLLVNRSHAHGYFVEG